MGGDREQCKAQNIVPCFNPRPRMGGDSPKPSKRMGGDKFQSTPPHGGRRGSRNSFGVQRQVSIHAPAWGATYKTLTASIWKGSFNPRPRMGGDGNEARKVVGAESFNPRPRMGGDYIMPYNQTKEEKFQSTPPHGGRPSKAETIAALKTVSIHAPAWGAT